MVRRPDSGEMLLANLLVSALLACGPAAPVDVGIDYVTVPAADASPDTDSPDESPTDPLDPVTGDFNGLINAGYERGEVSPYCRTSFQACGGLLAGTWVVEDNCNPETRSRDVLLDWGESRMALDETACWDAVQRLRWSWSGELSFEAGEAIDKRLREQQVDMQLSARCLSESFGLPETSSVSPQICDAMQDNNTTCALASGVCMCTNRTVSAGTASGVYGVLGLSVAIAANPTTRYEYCVDGDRLLWREKDGAQRQVVMRRTEEAPPGTVDPVELPR
jgi:hypothetical protein